MEKIILSWRILSFFGGWLKYGPGEVRRGTALDDLSTSKPSASLERERTGALGLIMAWGPGCREQGNDQAV